MPELAPQLLANCLLWFVAFVFSTTLHEAAHALVALRMGDPTAYLGGQVTLNPLPHIQREPFGMVVVPLLSFFLMGGDWMIGWASAPYDRQWAARYPRRSAWMALAGPAANLLIVLAAGLLVRLGTALGYLAPPAVLRFSEIVAGTGAPGSPGLAALLSILFVLNLVLFLFNLMPLPPMDGASAAQLLMSERVARHYQTYLYQPMWAWVGLLLAWRYFHVVFAPLFGLAVDLLYPGLYG